MGNEKLTENTVITIGKAISLTKYIAFFEDATGVEMPGCEFQPWLRTQEGKLLKDTLADYRHAARRKGMAELMMEERFSFVSGEDKAFILAFDEGVQELGYDCGGGIGEGYCWGRYMIIYTKTGVKNKQVAARVFIREDSIVLRLFFNNIDKHRMYIENAPAHIKAVFTNVHGNCGCNPKKENCRMRKTYTIDGKQIEKCSGVVFEFWNPTVAKQPDYIGLLKEFYPAKVKSR